jgi:hypothetical protein
MKPTAPNYLQKSIFEFSEILSINKTWKIVYRYDADTARLEKWLDGKKEFEILLHKDELVDLLSLRFNPDSSNLHITLNPNP